ncbi:hypothetical protein WQQ_12670 [Hydrocarboniphaga effusa AP103]|uniref:Uncharacterized protein n=1 Tax=Hydrocarboniphaga effusa AP103 TaxID=1172194 RepID=I8TBE1_9GAMM|nr:hypothetical protein WQQ_12670 [Hydrocarboniphaga effusa AP103]
MQLESWLHPLALSSLSKQCSESAFQRVISVSSIERQKLFADRRERYG